jgi:hypothetical protein
MTPEETFKNIGPVMLFVLIGLRFIAIPVGILVAVVVRRISPMVTSLIITVFAGYIVGFVVLFVVFHQVLPLPWYDAASISLVLTAAIVFYISYVIKRSLFARAAELKDEQAFKIFDEPVKGGPRKKHRRKHY